MVGAWQRQPAINGGRTGFAADQQRRASAVVEYRSTIMKAAVQKQKDMPRWPATIGSTAHALTVRKRPEEAEQKRRTCPGFSAVSGPPHTRWQRFCAADARSADKWGRRVSCTLPRPPTALPRRDPPGRHMHSCRRGASRGKANQGAAASFSFCEAAPASCEELERWVACQRSCRCLFITGS